MQVRFNVLLIKELNWYIAKCIDNNVASQGKTIDEALANLKEALELYYEDTSMEERTLPYKPHEALLTAIEVNLT